MSRLLPLTTVARLIHVVRGQRIMLSADLADLYDVEPKALVQAVKRNAARFPDDFMFPLTPTEWRTLQLVGSNLKSQTVTSSWGGARKPPLAFTEQGVAMLSSVLRSGRAIDVNIEIMRAFVRLREVAAGNRELAKKLKELEQKYDAQFRVVFEAIEELMEPPEAPRRRIGFGGDEA